jgi:hypothetical protein
VVIYKGEHFFILTQRYILARNGENDIFAMGRRDHTAVLAPRKFRTEDYIRFSKTLCEVQDTILQSDTRSGNQHTTPLLQQAYQAGMMMEYPQFTTQATGPNPSPSIYPAAGMPGVQPGAVTPTQGNRRQAVYAEDDETSIDGYNSRVYEGRRERGLGRDNAVNSTFMSVFGAVVLALLVYQILSTSSGFNALQSNHASDMKSVHGRMDQYEAGSLKITQVQAGNLDILKRLQDQQEKNTKAHEAADGRFSHLEKAVEFLGGRVVSIENHFVNGKEQLAIGGSANGVAVYDRNSLSQTSYFTTLAEWLSINTIATMLGYVFVFIVICMLIARYNRKGSHHAKQKTSKKSTQRFAIARY